MTVTSRSVVWLGQGGRTGAGMMVAGVGWGRAGACGRCPALRGSKPLRGVWGGTAL